MSSVRQFPTCTNHRRVWTRNLECLCDLTNLYCRQFGLYFSHIKLLRQPRGQIRWLPPSVGDGVVAEFLRHLPHCVRRARLRVPDQRSARHIFSGYFNSARATVAILHPFCSAEFADLGSSYGRGYRLQSSSSRLMGQSRVRKTQTRVTLAGLCCFL